MIQEDGSLHTTHGALVNRNAQKWSCLDGASKHGWELLCCRGPVVPFYGDAFMRFGQSSLRSACDVALQAQGAQPALVMAVKFLGGCGFATRR